MNATFRNILAVLAGIILGSIVNMGIVMLGPSVISAPEGVDMSNMDSLKANMHLFDAKHFIFPFLAHAIGTLSGAFLTYLIAIKNQMKLAMAIGFFFLLGGIVNLFMLPSPVWFAITDVALAYIPMAWLGGMLAGKIASRKQ